MLDNQVQDENYHNQQSQNFEEVDNDTDRFQKEETYYQQSQDQENQDEQQFAQQKLNKEIKIPLKKESQITLIQDQVVQQMPPKLVIKSIDHFQAQQSNQQNQGWIAQTQKYQNYQKNQKNSGQIGQGVNQSSQIQQQNKSTYRQYGSFVNGSRPFSGKAGNVVQLIGSAGSGSHSGYNFNSSVSTFPAASIQKLSDIKNPKQLLTFRFVNKLVTKIPEIQQFKNLRELDLSGNLLQEELKELNQLNFLKNLNLSNNRITNLWPLPKRIEILNLSDNQIKGITRNAASNLRNITTLDMSNNKLQSLENFDQMVRIKRLLIKNNFVQFLSCISNLENIYEVDISGNAVDCHADFLSFIKGKNDLIVMNLTMNPIMIDVDSIEKFNKDLETNAPELVTKKTAQEIEEFKEIMIFGAAGTTPLTGGGNIMSPEKSQYQMMKKDENEQVINKIDFYHNKNLGGIEPQSASTYQLSDSKERGQVIGRLFQEKSSTVRATQSRNIISVRGPMGEGLTSFSPIKAGILNQGTSCQPIEEGQQIYNLHLIKELADCLTYLRSGVLYRNKRVYHKIKQITSASQQNNHHQINKRSVSNFSNSDQSAALYPPGAISTQRIPTSGKSGTGAINIQVSQQAQNNMSAFGPGVFQQVQPTSGSQNSNNQQQIQSATAGQTPASGARVGVLQVIKHDRSSVGRNSMKISPMDIHWQDQQTISAGRVVRNINNNQIALNVSHRQGLKGVQMTVGQQGITGNISGSIHIGNAPMTAGEVGGGRQNPYQNNLTGKINNNLSSSIGQSPNFSKKSHQQRYEDIENLYDYIVEQEELKRLRQRKLFAKRKKLRKQFLINQMNSQNSAQNQDTSNHRQNTYEDSSQNNSSEDDYSEDELLDDDEYEYLDEFDNSKDFGMGIPIDSVTPASSRIMENSYLLPYYPHQQLHDEDVVSQTITSDLEADLNSYKRGLKYQLDFENFDEGIFPQTVATGASIDGFLNLHGMTAGLLSNFCGYQTTNDLQNEQNSQMDDNEILHGGFTADFGKKLREINREINQEPSSNVQSSSQIGHSQSAQKERIKNLSQIDSLHESSMLNFQSSEGELTQDHVKKLIKDSHAHIQSESKKSNSLQKKTKKQKLNLNLSKIMLDDNSSSQNQSKQKLFLQTSGIQTLLSLDLKACRPLNSTKNNNNNQQKLASTSESQASLHINLNLLNKKTEQIQQEEIIQRNLSSKKLDAKGTSSLAHIALPPFIGQKQLNQSFSLRNLINQQQTGSLNGWGQVTHEASNQHEVESLMMNRQIAGADHGPISSGFNSGGATPQIFLSQVKDQQQNHVLNFQGIQSFNYHDAEKILDNPNQKTNTNKKMSLSMMNDDVAIQSSKFLINKNEQNQEIDKKTDQNYKENYNQDQQKQQKNEKIQIKQKAIIDSQKFLEELQTQDDDRKFQFKQNENKKDQKKEKKLEPLDDATIELSRMSIVYNAGSNRKDPLDDKEFSDLVNFQKFDQPNQIQERVAVKGSSESLEKEIDQESIESLKIEISQDGGSHRKHTQRTKEQARIQEQGSNIKNDMNKNKLVLNTKQKEQKARTNIKLPLNRTSESSDNYSSRQIPKTAKIQPNQVILHEQPNEDDNQNQKCSLDNNNCINCAKKQKIIDQQRKSLKYWQFTSNQYKSVLENLNQLLCINGHLQEDWLQEETPPNPPQMSPTQPNDANDFSQAIKRNEIKKVKVIKLSQFANLVYTIFKRVNSDAQKQIVFAKQYLSRVQQHQIIQQQNQVNDQQYPSSQDIQGQMKLTQPKNKQRVQTQMNNQESGRQMRQNQSQKQPVGLSTTNTKSAKSRRCQQSNVKQKTSIQAVILGKTTNSSVDAGSPFILIGDGYLTQPKRQDQADGKSNGRKQVQNKFENFTQNGSNQQFRFQEEEESLSTFSNRDRKSLSRSTGQSKKQKIRTRNSSRDINRPIKTILNPSIKIESYEIQSQDIHAAYDERDNGTKNVINKNLYQTGDRSKEKDYKFVDLAFLEKSQEGQMYNYSEKRPQEGLSAKQKKIQRSKTKGHCVDIDWEQSNEYLSVEPIQRVVSLNQAKPPAQASHRDQKRDQTVIKMDDGGNNDQILNNLRINSNSFLSSRAVPFTVQCVSASTSQAINNTAISQSRVINPITISIQNQQLIKKGSGTSRKSGQQKNKQSEVSSLEKFSQVNTGAYNQTDGVDLIVPNHIIMFQKRQTSPPNYSEDQLKKKTLNKVPKGQMNNLLQNISTNSLADHQTAQQFSNMSALSPDFSLEFLSGDQNWQLANASYQKSTSRYESANQMIDNAFGIQTHLSSMVSKQNSVKDNKSGVDKNKDSCPQTNPVQKRYQIQTLTQTETPTAYNSQSGAPLIANFSATVQQNNQTQGYRTNSGGQLLNGKKIILNPNQVLVYQEAIQPSFKKQISDKQNSNGQNSAESNNTYFLYQQNFAQQQVPKSSDGQISASYQTVGQQERLTSKKNQLISASPVISSVTQLLQQMPINKVQDSKLMKSHRNMYYENYLLADQLVQQPHQTQNLKQGKQRAASGKRVSFNKQKITSKNRAVSTAHGSSGRTALMLPRQQEQINGLRTKSNTSRTVQGQRISGVNQIVDNFNYKN